MSLRLKIIAAFVVLGFGATAAIGLASYRSTNHELRKSIDRSLADVAARLERFPTIEPGSPGGRPQRDSDRDLERVLVQVIDSNGVVVQAPRSGELPIDDADIVVAAGVGPRAELRRDVVVEDERYRMFTVPVAGGAVQLARSLAEVDQVTEQIRQDTFLLGLLVAAVASLLGWLLASQLTRRLRQLTTVASQVAETGQLDTPVPVTGNDETGQLGAAFNRMLAALRQSKVAQQQLIQDAGHELRTPLTSLRTNVSVLQRYGALPADQRDQVLADIDSESRELTDLVNELVQLATDQRGAEADQRVVLGDLCEAAADRVRRRTGRQVLVEADSSALTGRPVALDRAIHNLIDNAAKFSVDGDVQVVVANGQVTVSDRGPGLDAQDLERIFDRFYRSDQARSRPGSGLGLAIVREIVESHGGTVFALQRPGGGASIGFRVPVDLPQHVQPPG